MKISDSHRNGFGDNGPAPHGGSNSPYLNAVFERMRTVQKRWSAEPVNTRLRTIKSLRHAIARNSATLVRAMKPRDAAHEAEMLSSQIIPLADACLFLEREAENLLRPRKPPGRAPFWLAGTRTVVLRESRGIVLVIAPSNYPLFLPGVTILQALAAGNAVAIKPAPECGAVMEALLTLLHDAGLHRDLATLLDEDGTAVYAALACGVDKLVFTGSARNGREILKACGSELLPATAELSGSDAMFVRIDADVKMAARALMFGLRLNRGATCIAPRRVFVHRSRADEFESECLLVAARSERWQLRPAESARVAALIVEAAAGNGRLILGDVDHLGGVIAPLIVANAEPGMRLLREDHFGPAAAIVPVASDDEAVSANEQCPYALGASIFSADKTEADALARRINAGVVTINDVIAPTADPRLPFGGRKHSGFGVTRGAEGLLDMTVPKVLIVRNGRWRPHLEETRDSDAGLLGHLLTLGHAAEWHRRIRSVIALFRIGRKRRQS